MDYSNMAEELLTLVGGRSNVTFVTHCATRLRFNLKKTSKMNMEAIKQIKGVLGAVYKGGQLQIIIGNDVSHLYCEVMEKGKFKFTNETVKGEKGSIFVKLLDVISGIFTPILPVLTGAGMIMATLVVLESTGLISPEGQTYYMFNLISDSGFYFLPIFLAYSSAQKFKANPYIAMMIAATLIHPDFTALVDLNEQINFLGLPVTLTSYASSVIPVILTTWVLSYVERFADYISPKPMKFFLKPLISIFLVAPAAFIVIGPLGTIIGDQFAGFVAYLSIHLGWAVAIVLSTLSPLLVMTGMHYSLIPITMTGFVQNGYDMILSPAMLVSNVAQGAAAIAVGLKTKNTNIRQLALSSGFTGVLGITEPAMYGINLRFKRPFIAVMIGGGVGGLYAGITGLASYGTAIPGLASLPIFISPYGSANLIHALIAVVISFLVTFALTWILGFEDVPSEENSMNDVKLNREKMVKSIQVFSPMYGRYVNIKKVKDSTFSQEILGKSFAVEPTEGLVVAPFSGVVSTLFKTKHAIAIKSDEGVDMLIHVGIDTVKLEGQFFSSDVKSGDHFEKGTVLLSFDIEAIKNAGYEVITPIIITNSSAYFDIIIDETLEELTPMKVILGIFN